MFEIGTAHYGQSDLALEQAILLYADAGKSQNYATIHRVHRTEAGPEIAAGELLSVDALQTVVSSLNRGAGLKDWVYVDPAVIAAGTTLQAWYTPSQARHVFFADHLGLTSGPATQPAMLWVRSFGSVRPGRTGADQLSVYCLGGDDRPTPATLVFESIHYNVWYPGAVCQGSMVKADFNDREGCMQSFWQSLFTHRNDQNKWRQAKHPQGLKGLWLDLLRDGGASPFPVKRLKPLTFTEGERKGVQMTVADVLNSKGGTSDV